GAVREKVSGIGRLRLFGILLLSVAALHTLTASAQTGASVAGRVLDPQSKPIAGAQVSIFARGGGARNSTTSDLSGGYRFDRLAPGYYLLQAEAPGFARFATEAVHVERGDKLSLDMTLQLARIQEQVVVTAASTPQTTDEVSKSLTLIDGQSI